MKLVDSVYPLAFPLLEDHENQGFMWEREWRYPKADGLVFDHSEIAVICCPPEEESGIRSILGVAVSRINFVRTWEEYDDVTDYLNRQQEVWASKRRGERMETTLEFRLKQLDEEIQERKIAANHLESYADVISQMAKEAKRAEEQRTRLLDDVQALQKEKAILVKRQAKAQAGEPADEESDEDEE